MKRKNRIVAFAVLFVAAALLLGGCGKAKKLAGTYEAEFNMKDMLNSELGENGIALVNDIMAEFNLVLKPDKTYTLDIDGKKVKDTVIEVIREQGDDLVKEALQTEGITEDMFDWIAQLSGYDDFFTLKEDLVNELIKGIDEEFGSVLENQIHVEGTYSVDGAKILLTANTEGEEQVEEGTIQEDNSISLNTSINETPISLIFRKVSE